MFEQKIAEAKSIPITEVAKIYLSGFVYGKNGPTCSCPRHKDEHMGNMKYYEKSNTFYCFSCSTKFDPIDIVSYALGTDFKSAIEELQRTFPNHFSAKEIVFDDSFLSIEELQKLGVKPILYFGEERISIPDLYKMNPEYVKDILEISLKKKKVETSLANKVKKIIFA